MAARVLTGLSHGVFFSIGSNIATSLVPKEQAASAIALMFTGLTVALGAWGGGLIAAHLGLMATPWRGAVIVVGTLVPTLAEWLDRRDAQAAGAIALAA